MCITQANQPFPRAAGARQRHKASQTIVPHLLSLAGVLGRGRHPCLGGEAEIAHLCGPGSAPIRSRWEKGACRGLHTAHGLRVLSRLDGIKEEAMDVWYPCPGLVLKGKTPVNRLPAPLFTSNSLCGEACAVNYAHNGYI